METNIRQDLFGVGDLLRKGWQYFQSNFKSIVIIVICIHFPFNIFRALIPVNYFLKEFGDAGLDAITNIVQLVENLFGLIAIMSISKIIEVAVEGQSISWSDAIKSMFQKWSKAIGVSIIAGFILMAFSFLLLIPGIIYSQYYCFRIQAVALRNKGGKTALDYSKSLVEGQWWRVFGINFGVGLVFLLPIIIIVVINDFVFTNQLVQIIPNTLLDFLTAFSIIITTLFFLNNDYVYQPIAKNEASPLIEKEMPNTAPENYLDQ